MTESRDQADSYSLETMYRVLRDRRRRLVLHHLRTEPDGVSTFDSVKKQVLEWESDRESETERDVHERKLTASLHHVHLPKLNDLGVIDYDWRTKAIRYRPSDVLETHLDIAAERDLTTDQ